LKYFETILTNYFRKRNVSVIYLAQNYTGNTGLPITIRRNISYLVVFLFASQKELKAILSDAAAGYTQEELLSGFDYANSRKIKNTNMPMPLLIDIVQNDRNKKFRININQFIEMPPPVPVLQRVISRPTPARSLSKELKAASDSLEEDSLPEHYENVLIGMSKIDLDGNSLSSDDEYFT
jgi:hypothetical protein